MVDAAGAAKISSTQSSLKKYYLMEIFITGKDVHFIL